MVIYNVTVGVDKAIEQEWLQWMKEVHIPDVMKTGMFVDNKVFKVIGTEETESVSYAVQYSANSIVEIDIYLKRFANALREESNTKFGYQQAAYRTILQEV